VDIRDVHAEVKQRYGSPRIHEELLKGRKVKCSVNTVARLMRENGIRAKSAKKFRNTTDSNHSHPVAENVLDRQFGAQAPNERWVADITYIETRESWLYLAAVEDLYSRMVVGWSMANHMESRLVVDALEMAVGGIASRRQADNCWEQHCNSSANWSRIETSPPPIPPWSTS
jgi:transposase InsO family protein